MDEKLVLEARKWGINAGMYCLLPPNRREKALKSDIERAKKGGKAANEQA